MQGIKIIGIGSYVPERAITNEDFTKFIDTSDEWIVTRTGIRERRFSTDKLTFEMAGEAAKKAVENAGVDVLDIDLILCSTCTPAFLFPSCSCLVQNIIGAKNAACIDTNAACTGFITALDMARRYLCTGDHKRILVVASEFLTRMLDYEDRGSCFLFGDGAAAVIVEAADTNYASVLGAEGDPLKSLYCKINYYGKFPMEGFDNTEQGIKDRLDTEQKNKYLQMDGKAVYKFAVDAMSKSVDKVCAKAGVAVEELDLVIPHQANLRIIQAAMKSMSVPEEKVYVNIERRANTSSACIPTCLDELRQAGKLKKGMKICLVGFGAGLTSGAIYFEY